MLRPGLILPYYSCHNQAAGIGCLETPGPEISRSGRWPLQTQSRTPSMRFIRFAASVRKSIKTILISWKPLLSGTLQVPKPCWRVAGYQKLRSVVR